MVAFLLFFCALGVRGYLPDNSLGGPHKGTWTQLGLSGNRTLGVRFHRGWALIWFIRSDSTAVPGIFDWHINNRVFGAASATFGCEVEGTMGVPWPAIEGMPRLHAFAVRVHHWSLAVILGLPTGLLLLKSLRRSKQNERCTVCKYDLKGNVSGVCPECGTQVTEPSPPN